MSSKISPQTKMNPVAPDFNPKVPRLYKGLADLPFDPQEKCRPDNTNQPYRCDGQPCRYDRPDRRDILLPNCYVVEQPPTAFGDASFQTSRKSHARRPRRYDGSNRIDPWARQPLPVPVPVQPSLIIGDAGAQSPGRPYSVSAIDGGSFADLVCVGSPEALLVFLHDNRHHFAELRSLSLQYRFFGEVVPFAGWDCQMAQYTGPTRIRAWRILWNVLTHWFTTLKKITVNVSREFWELAPWRGCSKVCIGTPNLCQAHLHPADRSPFPYEKRNFLEHIARVRTENVKIQIEGAHESQERMEFETNLNSLADNMRSHRKWYDTCTGCSCAAGCTLEETCFWRNRDWA